MKIFDVTKLVNEYESVSLWHSLPGYPVFGGQIVAQALNAVYQTVESGLVARSLHANFLAPAYDNKPIKYQIENVRDGKTIKNREVRAYQNNKLLFIANVSLGSKNNIKIDYQKYKLEKDTQLIMLNDFVKEKLQNKNKKIYETLINHLEYLNKHIEIKIGNICEGQRIIRFKSIEPIQNQADFSCFISFVSDFFLLESGLYFFNLDCFSEDIKFFTSVDHSIHFFDLNTTYDALYILPECYRISGDRFFCKEKIFCLDGTLIAEVTQEGIIRFSESIMHKYS